VSELVALWPTLALLLALTTGLWLVSLRARDASIIDIFWGPGFAVAAWWTLWTRGEPTARALLLATLVTLWGLRLGIHLARRNLGHGEDARYRAIREGWGPTFPLASLAIVFWLQGILIAIVALPVEVGIARASAAPPGWADAVGLAMFVAGLLCEAVADLQLARFKRDPASKGRVLDAGLWRYSRHPNYFGNFLLWWGLGVLGCASGAPLWTLAGPAVMSWLLVRVSGVALLERTIHERRPAYREYIRRTSAFIPWPPRGAPGDAAG